MCSLEVFSIQTSGPDSNGHVKNVPKPAFYKFIFNHTVQLHSVTITSVGNMNVMAIHRIVEIVHSKPQISTSLRRSRESHAASMTKSLKKETRF